MEYAISNYYRNLVTNRATYQPSEILSNNHFDAIIWTTVKEHASRSVRDSMNSDIKTFN